MPSSLVHFGSVGSLLIVPTITPTDLSRPAGFSVPATEPDGIDDHRWFPADFRGLSDSLGSEFWRACDKECFRARALQIDDLRIHGRFGDFVGGSHDPLVEIALQERAKRIDIVLSEIVVLVKDRVLAGRYRSAQVSGVDMSFDIVADEPGCHQGIILNVGELARAGDDRDTGDALHGRYFAVAVFPAVPSWLKM